MSKYKVGDEVYLRTDLEAGKSYNGIRLLAGGMEHDFKSGKKLKVIKVEVEIKATYYTVGRWGITEEMIDHEKTKTISKAKQMFIDLGYTPVDEPHKLNNEFGDWYSHNDIVYEYWSDWYNGVQRKGHSELRYRIYFIDGSWGFSAADNVGFEFEGTKLLEAILQQMKELG